MQLEDLAQEFTETVPPFLTDALLTPGRSSWSTDRRALPKSTTSSLKSPRSCASSLEAPPPTQSLFGDDDNTAEIQSAGGFRYYRRLSRSSSILSLSSIGTSHASEIPQLGKSFEKVPLLATTPPTAPTVVTVSGVDDPQLFLKDELRKLGRIITHRMGKNWLVVRFLSPIAACQAAEMDGKIHKECLLTVRTGDTLSALEDGQRAAESHLEGVLKAPIPARLDEPGQAHSPLPRVFKDRAPIPFKSDPRKTSNVKRDSTESNSQDVSPKSQKRPREQGDEGVPRPAPPKRLWPHRPQKQLDNEIVVKSSGNGLLAKLSEWFLNW
ncbi:hypothetical protein HKX48_004843 [Thoreauomyces humboldtii]|nr:hypothetical protein HKX48_004843 [Thoreauomyces humboldtii]